MALIREWSSTPTGPLVNPWMLLGRDARIVTLFGTVHSALDASVVGDSIPLLAEEVFAALMLLSQESSLPVKIIINSPGGSLGAGFTIIQAIEHLQAKKIDVEIVVTGTAASMASVILVAGTQGRRFIMERSLVHLHSGHGSLSGQPEDIEKIQAHYQHLLREIQLIYARRTKIPEYAVKTRDFNPHLLESEEGRIKLVKEFLGRETPLIAEDALEAGIVDDIIKAGDPRLDEIFNLHLKKGNQKRNRR